jgi:hypothetical protein
MDLREISRLVTILVLDADFIIENLMVASLRKNQQGTW